MATRNPSSGGAGCAGLGCGRIVCTRCSCVWEAWALPAVSSEVWPEAWAPACLGLSWAVPEWGLACTCVCEHPGLSPTSLWSCLWARGQGVPPLEPVLGTCAVSDTRGLPGPSIHQRWRLCEHPFRGWGTRLYRADSAEASGPWCWSTLPSEQELTRALPPLTLAVKWAWPSPGARP